jgi:DNA-binding SARP family transcriptional activator
MRRRSGGFQIGSNCGKTRAGVEFAILGSLEVRDGKTSVAIRRGKPAALLALLLLRRNQIVSTDRLVEGLWEGQPPRSAAKALQTYVSELRRVLPDHVLDTHPPGYVLHVPTGGVDSDRFEDALSRGRGALEEGRPLEAGRILTEALALWRGAALADFPYDRFAEAERERLEELRLSAVEARIEADLASGATAELVSELQNLVREHPLREGFTRQLMLALYRAGRQADALQRYRETRRMLNEMLGLEPSPALQRLQRAILEQDPQLAASHTRGEVAPPAPRVRRWHIVAGVSVLALLATLAVILAIARPDTASRESTSGTARQASTDDVRLPYPSVPARLLGTYRFKPELAIDRKWSARTMVVTLRPASDPVCTDLLGGDKTCFTMIPADNPADPGARGEVALVDGRKICVRHMRVPSEPPCEGEIHMYLPRSGGLFVIEQRAGHCGMPWFSRS